MTIALIDANAFYVSCELLFQPWLRGRAAVAASNNDGCVVSRNDEAKRLGIKMGTPVFELRELVRRGEVTVFSSNYELYQSLSNRVMAILQEQAPRVFVYSIDEAFVDLAGVSDPEGWSRMIQQQILRSVGLPVGVGIGPTKTLAKLANWAAKRWKSRTGCVVDLRDPGRQEKLLRYAPAGEVWGIGPRLSKRLAEDLKIDTAWQLASADPKHLRRHFNVNVERTARELLGTACFPFQDAGPERKQMIISSRSFGNKVHALEDLQEAVAGFVSTAAGKLRSQGSLANCIQVFAKTSPFSAGEQYSGSRILAMPYPADDTRDLLRAALTGLKALYRPGYAYAKAGVILSQFAERGTITGDLFAPRPRPNSERLMAVMDAINLREGRGTVRFARERPVGAWSMKRELLTPAYTTSWQGLAKVSCQPARSA
ncbi:MULTISPECIES: translesion error-prone DNA polymerase V subunit UmuC [Pseudomonas]|uniref:Translesion error-prone DNA polymerase V subunit UmuC n=1 Tax=Pseudomonas nitroreducens TaxID=46680 RepID=A0A6G6J7C4_PSENT|nr:MULTISPECIES: translesion error-prone DNA polymerase V subunit UmuC [Pseudomonas]QIE91117.1 translesion error-prone DNA polymerase V subunit UmuC [Pseudomonas nitroreducens]UCL90265.1 translesion error-prone DNA polymerase V subunit UmuC [Pseudomonas sp. HS-18]